MDPSENIIIRRNAFSPKTEYNATLNPVYIYNVSKNEPIPEISTTGPDIGLQNTSIKNTLDMNNTYFVTKRSYGFANYKQKANPFYDLTKGEDVEKMQLLNIDGVFEVTEPKENQSFICVNLSGYRGYSQYIIEKIHDVAWIQRWRQLSQYRIRPGVVYEILRQEKSLRKFCRFFAFPPMKQGRQFEQNKTSLHFFTRFTTSIDGFKETLNSYRREFGYNNNLIVADITACVGGESLAISTFNNVDKVLSFDVSEGACDILKRNIKNFDRETSSKIEVLNVDSIELIQTDEFLADIVYFDPPWPQDFKEPTECIEFADMDSAEFIIQMMNKTNMLVFKVPLAFVEANLASHISDNNLLYEISYGYGKSKIPSFKYIRIWKKTKFSNIEVLPYSVIDIEKIQTKLGENYASLVVGALPRNVDVNPESIYINMFWNQTLAAINLLGIGGNFVMRIHTIHMGATVDIIYLLHILFAEVIIFKPITCNIYSGEKYIVCRHYRRRSKIKDIDLSSINPKSGRSFFNIRDMHFYPHIRMLNNIFSLKRIEYMTIVTTSVLERRLKSLGKSYNLDNIKEIWGKRSEFRQLEVVTSLCAPKTIYPDKVNIENMYTDKDVDIAIENYMNVLKLQQNKDINDWLAYSAYNGINPLDTIPNKETKDILSRTGISNSKIIKETNKFSPKLKIENNFLKLTLKSSEKSYNVLDIGEPAPFLILKRNEIMTVIGGAKNNVLKILLDNENYRKRATIIILSYASYFGFRSIYMLYPKSIFEKNNVDARLYGNIFGRVCTASKNKNRIGNYVYYSPFPSFEKENGAIGLPNDAPKDLNVKVLGAYPPNVKEIIEQSSILVISIMTKQKNKDFAILYIIDSKYRDVVENIKRIGYNIESYDYPSIELYNPFLNTLSYDNNPKTAMFIKTRSSSSFPQW